MSAQILGTKLYLPPPRPNAVPRPRLLKRLRDGVSLGHKLTLISAPAGFGKTTIASEWLTHSGPAATWLSLDEGDNDPARFLIYLASALQRRAAQIGQSVLGFLQAPQIPAVETILTTLLNEISALPEKLVLVLDDYHVIEAKTVNDALVFLLEHLPPQLHLVIVTREDPDLPLGRLRASGQLTELRAADLRFTPAEAAEFLNRVMGLHLATEDVAALETRTEGWVAGLQLAALALQGTAATPPAGFIQSFTGSHQFVLDYLMEEVLQQQPAPVQTFLLHTALLNRMCGPLCEAVLPETAQAGQEMLAQIERANLFIIPLDNERRWYRYHHLFADLLRQRLRQKLSPTELNELHLRASQWLETNGFELEAFEHAAQTNDIERTERLIGSRGIPFHFRGAVMAILNWMDSLPAATLRARPWLWWRHASLLLVSGQTLGVEEKLQAAEAALQGVELNETTRNLLGRIANARATLALTRYDADEMLAQSHRALEYLSGSNSAARANPLWTLGNGYMFKGERTAAAEAYTESIAISQVSGDVFTNILAAIGLGRVQEANNQFQLAAQTYRHVLQMAGDQPLQIINEAHLGLARVLYEWNDLDAAEQHTQHSLQLARQYERGIDRFILSEIFLARLQLARGDVAGAASMLAQINQTAREKNFVHRLPDVAAAQVPVLLRQGNVTAASALAQAYPLPLSQVRVLLAQGKAEAALAILEPHRQLAEAKHWADEHLNGLVLQALAYQVGGEAEKALPVLSEALRLAEPSGHIRLFVDEGPPMLALLTAINASAVSGIGPNYLQQVLAAFGPQPIAKPQPLIEPLSPRELEVLQLIAHGLSNEEIGERLFLALNTVKGHNRKIFEKLHVERRTEAVARARELGLL